MLTAPEVQQIAGRAGRGSVHGTVSALNEEALHHIRACLGVAPDPVPRAGLAPSLEQLLLHAGGGDVADNARLQKMLEDFVDDWDEGHQSNFFLCDLTEITVLAGVTEYARCKGFIVCTNFGIVAVISATSCRLRSAISTPWRQSTRIAKSN